MKAHLLIIDPQVDFMDMPGSALPVTGAVEDMRRVAVMLERIGGKLADIHTTLDSHQAIHIAHPGFWVNKDGKNPGPFTLIASSDVAAGIWRPRNEHVRPAELGGMTLGEWVYYYLQQLKEMMVWPEHCRIGSAGYAIQPDLEAVLAKWARRYFANVDFMAKGTTTYTEHFGAFMAEVVMPSVPATGLNASALQVLAEADIIGVVGEALSHCVLKTVDQIANNIGPEHIAKFHILVDASSPVPQAPGGPNFAQIADEWLHRMEKLGMTLTTTDKFLA